MNPRKYDDTTPRTLAVSLLIAILIVFFLIALGAHFNTD